MCVCVRVCVFVCVFVCLCFGVCYDSDLRLLGYSNRPIPPVEDRGEEREGKR